MSVSGSKVGASSVLGSGPISCVCKPKTLAYPVVRSVPPSVRANFSVKPVRQAGPTRGVPFSVNAV